ncbi:MAG: topA, partial [Clostridia bacterium]|nr:topA [Clostridia bacterium]
EPEQYRLYKLIWERFVASQMSSAVYDTISVDISANGYIFKATDSKIRFPGFTVLYNYSEDTDENASKLPDKIAEGDLLKFKELISEQKFTQPPSRFTEASLIKALEENGIGRPSTYAPTIGTILERHYIEKDAKALIPTQLGYITTDIMKDHFKDIVDVTFTADMEEKLDEIEDDKKTYKEIISGFYTNFEKTLKTAEENMDGIKIEIPNEESDVVCDLCGSKMVYKVSKFGRFLACPNYPECKNTKPILVEAEGNCPVCGEKMLLKKSKKGKVYYSCSNAPNCPFMTWDVPTKETCPNCNSSLFKHFSKLHCLKEGCNYEQK